MISHSLKLLNEFMKVTKYYQDNDFHESDFIVASSNSAKSKDLLEAHKDKTITYKDITFSISFFVTINELTDEIYSIAFDCYEVDEDNHIIITEYLTMMMTLFIDFISSDMFLTIDENETIIQFFQLYLKERKDGYFSLSTCMTSIVQDHIEIAHQFYNQKHYVYFNAVAHQSNTISLQLIFFIKDINKNINTN